MSSTTQHTTRNKQRIEMIMRECDYCENLTSSKEGNYRGKTACGSCKRQLLEEDRREEAWPSCHCVYCDKKGIESPMNLQDWDGHVGYWTCDRPGCDAEYTSKGRKKWSRKSQDPRSETKK